MAKAKAGPRRTTRNVTLRLTEGEADFILGTLAHVGGWPAKSPRKYADRIRRALEETLGYDYTETDAYAHGVGHIEFRNYNTPEVEQRERIMAYLKLADFVGADGLDPETEVALELIALGA